MKSSIAKLVNDYGNVTFPELVAKIPEAEGDQYLALPGFRNIWLWAGLSSEAIDEERKLFVHRASEITRLSYGGTLDLPLATRVHAYSKPHWFVCVLHHSPIEEES